MTFSRGRLFEFARGRNRSWVHSGVRPNNVAPPPPTEPPHHGRQLSVAPRVVFGLHRGRQSFFWSGVNPAAERTELYRAVLTRQMLPEQPRSFLWSGNRPTDVAPVTATGLPNTFSNAGRQAAAARNEATKSFMWSGNMPTNVAAQVPLFGTLVQTRPQDVSGTIQPSWFIGASAVTPVVIPGPIAGIFYYHDIGEYATTNNRSWIFRGVPQEEPLFKPIEIGTILQGPQVGDLGPSFQNFLWSGNRPDNFFPEIIKSVMTIQQLPMDIQRYTLYAGVTPANFFPPEVTITRGLFTLQQIPLDPPFLSFTNMAVEEIPPAPTPTPPPPSDFFPGTGAGEPPAKHHGKRKFVVEIDGQQFEVRSREEAEALLQRAAGTATESISAEVAKYSQIAQPKRKDLRVLKNKLQTPLIGSPDGEIEPVVAEYRAQIEQMYAQAVQEAEAAAQQAIQASQQDDEDDFMMNTIL